MRVLQGSRGIHHLVLLNATLNPQVGDAGKSMVLVLRGSLVVKKKAALLAAFVLIMAFPAA